MQITFISAWQALVTIVVLAIAFVMYAKLVRPQIKDTWAFKGFYGKVVPWLKARWDIVTAFIIAMAPIVWNGALDLIIAISLVTAELLPVINGIDLSAFVLPPWVKTSIQIGAAAVPAVRAALLSRAKV